MAARLVVALDVAQAEQAERIVDDLYELDLIYKVGMEPLYGYGERIFSHMQARDVRHFIDAKLHDIPRTVAAGIKQLVRHGTHIVNVHALGGTEMMRAAVEATRARAGELDCSPPHVFAVTILTSMGERDLSAVGLSGTPEQAAIRLAALARDAGCSGVVCSAHEVAGIKRALGSQFLTLTPGIRPAHADRGDQKRVTTAAQAVAAGSDYVVVGRPITQAPDPLAAARQTARRNGGAMTGIDLERELKERGALLDGHFRLSSGRHSDRFIQKFRILEDPEILEPTAREIAAAFAGAHPTVVVSAAVGGILLGYEVARALGTKAIFVEKENGIPVLRRNFSLTSHDRALVVEDVITTGGSVKEVLRIVHAHGARVLGVGAIVSRSQVDFGVPTHALLAMPIASYEQGSCPQCARGEALSEPGSRRTA